MGEKRNMTPIGLIDVSASNVSFLGLDLHWALSILTQCYCGREESLANKQTRERELTQRPHDASDKAQV